MFKNPFSFNGRIRRKEFCLTFLIYMIAVFVIEFIPGVGGGYNSNRDTVSSILYFMLFLPLIWFMLAQSAKRCHDRGNSGWFQFIPFYFFWLLFADSEPGENQYGPNPKGIGNFDEIDEIGNNLV